MRSYRCQYISLSIFPKSALSDHVLLTQPATTSFIIMDRGTAIHSSDGGVGVGVQNCLTTAICFDVGLVVEFEIPVVAIKRILGGGEIGRLASGDAAVSGEIEYQCALFQQRPVLDGWSRSGESGACNQSQWE